MFRVLAARVGRAVFVAMGLTVAGPVGGCAQLVGIDNTEPAGNSIRLVRTSIGAKVVQSPIDLEAEGLSATYLVSGAGGTGIDRVAATAGDDGLWTTRLRAPAPVEATLPDVPAPVPWLYDLPSQRVLASFDVLEHPGRAPAPDGAMFGVTVPIDTTPTANDAFRVYVVGAWLEHRILPTGFTVVDNAQLVIQPFSFAANESISGRARLDRLTAADAFFVLRYVGSQLTGVAAASAFDQSDQPGVTASVTTAPLMPVAAAETLDIKIAVSALVTRYAKIQPAVTMPATSWLLVAAPGYAVTNSAGPVLQSGTLAATDPALVVKYGNPFVDRMWRTCFTLRAIGTRVFNLPGTPSSITLEAGFVTVIEAPSQAGSELAVAAGASAGIPVGISLNRTLLSTDGQAIKQPTGFVEVTFSLDKLPEVPGAVRYFLLVQELVPGAADTLERRQALVAVSTEPRFSLPPEVFQAGHSYVLRAISRLGGFTSADVGDLVTRALPFTQGHLDSAVIQVTP